MGPISIPDAIASIGGAALALQSPVEHAELSL